MAQILATVGLILAAVSVALVPDRFDLLVFIDGISIGVASSILFLSLLGTE